MEVRIQNLGKLADATVRVGGLTVLAGVNNTGKSFFSKFLYSVLETVNKSFVARRVEMITSPIVSDLLSRSLGLENKEELVALVGQVEEASIAIGVDSRPVKVSNPDFARLVDKAAASYSKISPYDVKHKAMMGDEFNVGDATHGRLTTGFGQLLQLIERPAEDIALDVASDVLVKNLTENFQVFDLLDLQKNPNAGIFAEVAGIGSLTVNAPSPLEIFRARGEDDSVAKMSRFDPGLLELRKYPRVIYLDSPALWKMQVALGYARRLPRLLRMGNDRITGVPKYFYDLVDDLRGSVGKATFPEIAERLTGKKGIGGRIEQNSVGMLFFHESEKRFPLSVTATGVANLGILALLIGHGILDKGTFLFIDEPESNLHPEWQMAMTEALYELARGGVRVVVATHSVDILKRLEIYAKEEAETANKIIAVNHFQRNGTVRNGGAEMIPEVKEDLSEKFFDLYMRGMR